MIPTAVQRIAVARLAELDAMITPLVTEARELRAWLNIETSPESTRIDEPRRLTESRSTSFPATKMGSDERPQRLRVGTEEVEHFFTRGSYSTAAKTLIVGTRDVYGVWLTVDEWRAVKADRQRAKAGGYAA